MKPQSKFNEEDWAKVAHAAVMAGAVLWLTMLAVMVFAPPPAECPGWRLRHGQSPWELLLFWGLPLNAFGCLTAINRDLVIRHATEADYFSGMSPAQFFVCLCVIESAIAQFPLFLLVTNCF